MPDARRLELTVGTPAEVYRLATGYGRWCTFKTRTANQVHWGRPSVGGGIACENVAIRLSYDRVHLGLSEEVEEAPLEGTAAPSG